MINRVFGIDLGTGHIKICSQNGKKFINERNMFAIRDDVDVLAIGDAAYEMYEKAPQNVDVSCPMVNGVIGNINNTELLLAGLLKKIMKVSVKRSVFYIAVPSDISEVEKRAFFAVVKGSVLRAAKVRIVEKAIADAVYIGIDLEQELGNMIVNIGAETTEISILSGHRVILSKTLDVGGKKLDESIATIIRRRYNLSIGLKTAERLKHELAYVCNGVQKDSTAFGLNIVAGLPRQADISSATVSEAIIDDIDYIIDNIKSMLERTPPELVKDIKNQGIYLTGGSSGIRNLAYYIQLETDISISETDNPSESTIQGLRQIMQDKNLKSLTYSLKKLQRY